MRIKVLKDIRLVFVDRTDDKFEAIVRSLVERDFGKAQHSDEMDSSVVCGETDVTRRVSGNVRYTMGQIREFNEEMYSSMVSQLRQLDGAFVARVMDQSRGTCRRYISKRVCLPG